MGGVTEEMPGPMPRRVAVVAFGDRAAAVVAETVAGTDALIPATAEAVASGEIECDLIVMVADADSPCPGVAGVEVRARDGRIAMLALVLDATSDTPAAPAAAALREVADTMVLTTDDELLAVMARWLERAA